MDFIIPNLELILPDITTEYQRLKIASREVQQKANPSKKRDYYKDKYQELMSKVSKLIYFNELEIGNIRTTKTDIATGLGVTVETLNRYLSMKKKEDRKPNVHNVT